ncbi:MAG: hypothetical protein MI742_01780 [Desulfobacterales bacterium]|nr:hypothetical protein [Desulfobacterales bacterium]
MKWFYVLVSVCVLSVGCMGNQVVPNSRPGWVINPAIPGAVAAVGYSASQIKGYSAQRSMAIQAALDEIARQMGVTISNTTLIGKKSDGTSVSSEMETWSFSTVDNKKVTAHVKESWLDPSTEALYVWMVAK